jgi:hypothetical protein
LTHAYTSRYNCIYLLSEFLFAGPAATYFKHSKARIIAFAVINRCSDVSTWMAILEKHASHQGKAGLFL